MPVNQFPNLPPLPPETSEPEPKKPCPCSWNDKAKAIALVIGAFGTSVVAPIVGGMFLHNKIDSVDNKVVAVETKQDVATTAAENAKKAIEARDVKMDKTAAKIDKVQADVKKTADVVADTTGPTLWASWKFLEQVAADSPTPENKSKATEAKAAYDAWLRKK